jgi:hypothetical protein
MQATRFVGLAYPRPALVDATAPEPRRYYGDLVTDLLRCSAPASRRLGAVRAAVARHGLARLPLSTVMALSPARPHPDMARVRHDLIAAWDDLAATSSRLPAQAPDLSLLCLRRSMGWLIFAFGEGADPLLVCKLPDGDDPRVDQEAEILRSVAELDFAPVYLGRVGKARVQEALPGHPLRLAPLSAGQVTTAAWDDELSTVADALLRLGRLTTGPGLPPRFLSPEAESWLPPEIAARVRTSVQRLTDLDISVLCHGDASAQNVLTRAGTVSGLVDWEFAQRGMPGSDVVNLMHSVFEQRLGLRRWRERDVVDAFAAAWTGAPLFVEGRQAARAAAEAAGVPGRMAHDVEIAVYARRLQRRVDVPGYLVGPQMAADMLATVCASAG